ncbi:GumC family protein [Nostoc sp. LEGE 12450]|uniref:GumC family protein n=1 Tax=Nostoc sp. LEGE 12450 TaxID=1828643 RepID=UPI001881F442|nr:GumC family protein [Nostoc sp. LEGE 12450]MBE8986250.1 GumC family protein [Nostoc sp. LEGE 12450]
MESQTESIVTFNTYLQILKRRWLSFIIIFFPALLISLLPLLLRQPNYMAEGKLLFHKTNITSSLTGVGTEINKLESVFQDQTNPLNTEAEVIRSIPIVQKAINKLNLKDDKGELINLQAFLKKLTVNNIDGTDILLVSYQDNNPEIATEVVNKLMDAYLEYNVSAQRNQTTAARKFLEKQMPNAELTVLKAEADIAKFKENYKSVSLPEEASKAVENIADLQKKFSEAQSRIADIDAQSKEIREQLGMNSRQAMIKTSLSQISGVQDILKEIQQLESQLTLRRTVVKDTHPQILDLEDKLKSLNKLLQQRIKKVTGTNKPQLNQNFELGELQQQLSAKLIELESTHLGLESQAAALSNLQASHKKRLSYLPRLEQQQRQLERKAQVAQSTYLLLQQKLEESRLAENQNLGNASILSEAQVPQEPISSPFMLVSASLLAILATLVAIFILEATDKSIKTVDETKSCWD